MSKSPTIKQLVDDRLAALDADGLKPEIKQSLYDRVEGIIKNQIGQLVTPKIVTEAHLQHMKAKDEAAKKKPAPAPQVVTPPVSSSPAPSSGKASSHAR